MKSCSVFFEKKLMLQDGRHTRPDDKCQDPFPLKEAESVLYVTIFLLASPQKRISTTIVAAIQLYLRNCSVHF